MKKDIISKEALKAITEDIAIYLLGLHIDNVEFVDKELLRIEKREADIVATCLIDGEASILHLEIQNANDGKMAQRMLRYRLDIMSVYADFPIFQYLNLYWVTSKNHIGMGVWGKGCRKTTCK